MKRADWVGPVLQPGVSADAVIAAIRELNPGVTVTDRGGYLRVQAPGRCRVTRLAVEEFLGQRFTLPGDLERIMPSFAGRLSITEDQALWEWQPKERAHE